MVLIGVFVALMIFIYFNRYLQCRREERREQYRERREAHLEALLRWKKKHSSEPNDEGSDTTAGQ